MRASLRFPVLVAIGLTIGLVIGLALAHFFWIAAVVILGFLVADFLRRRRA
ncbi:MAG: hypothetical protein QOG85_758 [Gaiellaceae bacterium]|jgi:hypothetical protein|nr:hypothetical protein [Gaiellaceae bacterium]